MPQTQEHFAAPARREVFVREDSTEMLGTNPVLVHEKRVRMRAAAGSFTVPPPQNAGAVRGPTRFARL